MEVHNNGWMARVVAFAGQVSFLYTKQNTNTTAKTANRDPPTLRRFEFCVENQYPRRNCIENRTHVLFHDSQRGQKLLQRRRASIRSKLRRVKNPPNTVFLLLLFKGSVLFWRRSKTCANEVYTYFFHCFTETKFCMSWRETNHSFQTSSSNRKSLKNSNYRSCRHAQKLRDNCFL